MSHIYKPCRWVSKLHITKPGNIKDAAGWSVGLLVYHFVLWDWMYSIPHTVPFAMNAGIITCPRGLTFTWWGGYGLRLWPKPAELAHSLLFCSRGCYRLYGPFNCISFCKFSRQLSAFSLCSFGLISASLALSTTYLFIEISFNADVILNGWLGLKHQLTN